MGATMFTIEFVTVRGRDYPGIVERTKSTAHNLSVAEQTARGLLNGVRHRFPDNPPDGFQIVAEDGMVMLRSWERQF